MIRGSRRRQRGTSMVEVIVSASICATIVGLGVTLTKSATNDANGIYTRTSLAIRAAESADLLTRELQTSTLSGEDQNANHAIDAGEDLNRDGRLDSDWSLADGASASSITFNVPVNGWMWSGPVRYSISGGNLLRRENGLDRKICGDVTAFQVTRSGDVLDVDLTLSGRDKSGQVWTETAHRSSHVRN